MLFLQFFRSFAGLFCTSTASNQDTLSTQGNEELPPALPPTLAYRVKRMHLATE